MTTHSPQPRRTRSSALAPPLAALVHTPPLAGDHGGQRTQAPVGSARPTRSVYAGEEERPPFWLRPDQGISADIASGRRGRRFKSGHPDQVRAGQRPAALGSVIRCLVRVRFWERNGSGSCCREATGRSVAARVPSRALNPPGDWRSEDVAGRGFRSRAKGLRRTRT